MGLGFSVGRGVRLHAGTRGVGVSAGAGPFRVYSGTGYGSRRRSSGPSRTSVAAHERQLRAQRRLEEVQAVANVDRELLSLCNVHEESLAVAAPWRVPAPEPVDVKAFRRERQADAVAGISALRFGERRAAKKAIDQQLEDAVAAEADRRRAEAARRQAELDRAWEALVLNESDAVLGMLERAFADNETPAAAVSCRDARVDILVRWPTLDAVVSERKAATTPSGKPTIHKRSKTERAEFYLWALASNALITAKETFAVCPSIERIGLAVVRCVNDGARGDQIIETLFLGTLDRARLADVRWSEIKPIATLLELSSGRVAMRGKGSNKTLYGLEIKDADEREFIETVASGLGCRVPDSGVPGLPLPVTVVHQ